MAFGKVKGIKIIDTFNIVHIILPVHIHSFILSLNTHAHIYVYMYLSIWINRLLIDRYREIVRYIETRTRMI